MWIAMQMYSKAWLYNLSENGCRTKLIYASWVHLVRPFILIAQEPTQASAHNREHNKAEFSRANILFTQNSVYEIFKF